MKEKEKKKPGIKPSMERNFNSDQVLSYFKMNVEGEKIVDVISNKNEK